MNRPIASHGAEVTYMSKNTQADFCGGIFDDLLVANYYIAECSGEEIVRIG